MKIIDFRGFFKFEFTKSQDLEKIISPNFGNLFIYTSHLAGKILGVVPSLAAEKSPVGKKNRQFFPKNHDFHVHLNKSCDIKIFYNSQNFSHTRDGCCHQATTIWKNLEAIRNRVSDN